MSEDDGEHMNPTRRDPIRLYAHALREGDLALAQLLHRRFIREALAVRVLGSLRARLR